MANYYTVFSTAMVIESEMEYRWLKNKLDKLSKVEPGDDDWANDFAYRFDKDAKGKHTSIWFHTDESGTPEHVADLVQEFLKKFDKKSAFKLEWSNWCDKDRLDAFGGGAVVVTAKEQKWLNTGRWADEMAVRLTKRKK